MSATARIERVRASEVCKGETVWVQADRDWMTVKNIRTDSDDWTLVFSRSDSSIAEFEPEEWVLRRVEEAECDELRGLLTLWLNLAPVQVRAIVPGLNGKTLADLTREAFDRA